MYFTNYMKIIFKLFLFIFPVLLFGYCKKSTGPEDNTPPDDDHEKDTVVYFQDFNFYSAILELGVDADSNGFISYEEAEKLTTLDVHEKNISDMKGIEAFVNLTYLNCSNNELYSLDLNKNTLLESIECDENNLTSLLVTNDSSLVYLSCNYNNLSSLKISGNILLKYLYCNGNQITSLNVSHNTTLEILECDINKIPGLNVSGLSSLERLRCGGNQLQSINVSNNSVSIGWI